MKKNLSKSDVTLKDIQRKMKEMSNTMKKGQKQAAVIKQKSNNSNYGKQKKNKYDIKHSIEKIFIKVILKNEMNENNNYVSSNSTPLQF